MQIWAATTPLKRLRNLSILVLMTPGCSGSPSMATTPQPVAALVSTAASPAADQAAQATDTQSRKRHMYPGALATAAPTATPSAAADAATQVAAAVTSSTMCVDGNQYTQSFNDDFSSFPAVGGLSGAWQTSYLWGRTNPGALDDAYYIDDSVISAASQTADGITSIKPSKNDLELIASRTPSALASIVSNHPYVSGAINSSRLFSQTYGYFEASMTMPTGQGLWPAFWLLPTYGYPPEIDIMENLGNDPNHVYETTHSAVSPVQQTVTSVANGVAGTHVYGVAWTSSSIEYFIDGVKVSTENNISNQPMYMVLNLAVGNAASWPGAPNAATAFPATMHVQYVHAYALTANHC